MPTVIYHDSQDRPKMMNIKPEDLNKMVSDSDLAAARRRDPTVSKQEIAGFLIDRHMENMEAKGRTVSPFSAVMDVCRAIASTPPFQRNAVMQTIGSELKGSNEYEPTAFYAKRHQEMQAPAPEVSHRSRMEM